MIKYAFGILDILTGIALIVLYFDFFNIGFLKSISIFIFILFLLKSLVFLPNIASFVDLVGGTFFILGFFGFFSPFTWVAVFWLCPPRDKTRRAFGLVRWWRGLSFRRRGGREAVRPGGDDPSARR